MPGPLPDHVPPAVHRASTTTATITGSIRDSASGGLVPSCVIVRAADGRTYAPPASPEDRLYSYSGEGFLGLGEMWTYHYRSGGSFYCPGAFEVSVPPGDVDIWIARGWEHRPIRARFRLGPSER